MSLNCKLLVTVKIYCIMVFMKDMGALNEYNQSK